MKKDIKILQDSDCHWYWIPIKMADEFKNDNEYLSGKDYMDDPEAYEDFIEKYEKYRTHGAPDLVPEIFKNGITTK